MDWLGQEVTLVRCQQSSCCEISKDTLMAQEIPPQIATLLWDQTLASVDN